MIFLKTQKKKKIEETPDAYENYKDRNIILETLRITKKASVTTKGYKRVLKHPQDRIESIVTWFKHDKENGRTVAKLVHGWKILEKSQNTVEDPPKNSLESREILLHSHCDLI